MIIRLLSDSGPPMFFFNFSDIYAQAVDAHDTREKMTSIRLPSRHSNGIDSRIAIIAEE